MRSTHPRGAARCLQLLISHQIKFHTPTCTHSTGCLDEEYSYIIPAAQRLPDLLDVSAVTSSTQQLLYTVLLRAATIRHAQRSNMATWLPMHCNVHVNMFQFNPLQIKGKFKRNQEPTTRFTLRSCATTGSCAPWW